MFNKLKPKQELKQETELVPKQEKKDKVNGEAREGGLGQNDKPSKEALLEFLIKDQDVIEKESENKAKLVLTRHNSMTGTGGIYIYNTIQILKYLKVEIINRQEIIDFLEKNKRPDTGVYIDKGETLNLSDSIDHLNCFKLLGHKVNNPELEVSLLSFNTKKNKLKRYADQDSVGIYEVLKLMSLLGVSIDKEYWTKEIAKYQLPSGYYSEEDGSLIGSTQIFIGALKILGHKSDSPYLRKSLDKFKTHYKGNYIFRSEYKDKDTKDVQFLPNIFRYLKLFQGLEDYGHKEDFIQAVKDSWGENYFHEYIDNHERGIPSLMDQAEALEILGILGGQELIDEVMQVKN